MTDAPWGDIVRRMSERYVALQRAHHRRADAVHFRWQTETPYFADTEAALTAGVIAQPGERVLEIGCGEGGNLHHLGARRSGARIYGVDFSAAKVAFARAATGALMARADAARLPFADASFDAVLIRDLLHHLPDRGGALAEARRVLKPGGRLTLVEPNRRAPLVLLQAALVPAERGLFRSTAERLREELRQAGFRVRREAALQPMPIARVVAHPRLGGDKLLALAPVRAALQAVDRAAARVVPRRAWAYLAFQAERT